MNYEQICDIEEALQEARLSLQHKNKPEKKTLKQALKIIDGIIWNWGNYSYADNKEQEIKDLEHMINKAYYQVFGKDSPAKQKIAQACLIIQDSKNEGSKEFLEEFSDEV